MIIRRYGPDDFDPVNDLWRRARVHAYGDFQARKGHTVEEDRDYFRGVVQVKNDLWVAEVDECPAAGYVKGRPELAHAARDQVGVVVQVGARGEGRQVRRILARKALQIENLPGRDGGEDAPDLGAVGLTQEVDPSRDLVDALEEPALPWLRLTRSARGGDGMDVDPFSRVGAAQRLQVSEAIRAGDEPGVGHGVARASEQIRESDGFAHVPGQDGKRQVETAAHVPEKAAEQLVGGGAAPHVTSRSRRDGVAGRASPSPS